MEMTINFSERLSELMVEKGVNQSQLARMTGISNQAISLWLGAKREPNLRSLVVLAIFFDCSIDYLVGRVDSL